MYRAGVALALAIVFIPNQTGAQSLSLTSASASGDCSGTSFHQAADASGKYLAAEWAVAGQYPIGVNRGRSRCAIRFTVTVQTGYKIVAGSGTPANRLATAQLTPVRLNGATSQILVESAFSFDNAAGATATASASNGAPVTFAMLALDRPSAAPSLESVCSTAAKNTFQIGAVVDAATASSYVIPWPPEPYAERETASMGGVRVFYEVVPCAPRRSVSAGAELAPVKPQR